ncbi:hypothetical protein N7U66_20775 [Lacinutrix neustonica]|uniref:histidine kinase n=1 Tax=Lacinutrix neustonica TaxID=2980107 RepID=A0A9E8MV73_9FLAO|nr:histidine kinase dimerization/phospho-acceptor domain-containing protein [Lacinutrix neustonica]WAC02173.1 hypothetical protein N7U66_20775 [Lacinutrix neustonica]
MDIWQNQVTKEVPASKEANAISLYDHLPNIIEDIADLMVRFNDIEDISKDEKYNEILENSKHHGRHRSSTAYYTVEQVVHEYIIFHRTLSDFLISRNGCNEKVSDLLKYVIETSILKSVGSFSRAIQEMQEKLIGTLAHDIRNPLSAAQLALEMMDKDEDQEWNDNLILASKRSVSKGLNLLEGLMDGITIKAGEGILLNFEAGDVLEHVKWVVTEAKEFYTNDILFECDEAQLLGVFDSTAVKRLL